MNKFLIFIVFVGALSGLVYAQSAQDIQNQLTAANNILEQQNEIISSAQKDIDADTAQIQDRENKINIANGIIQTTSYQINYWSNYLYSNNSEGTNWTDNSIIIE